jgi:hypothetical protein
VVLTYDNLQNIFAEKKRMKKITTFFVLLSIYQLVPGIALFAQPILVNTMTPFPVGTTDSVYSALPSIAPGAGGAGVTWNLSGLVANLQGTVSVVTPSSTPYAATFPTTTFCAKLTIGINTAYVYERLTAGKWEQLANNYAGPGTGTDYTPNPESALEFPMSYLNSFIDTFQKTGGGANTVTVTYDGYGTLITPFATYTNVVRIYKYWGPGDFDYNWYTTSPNLGIVASFDAQNNAYTLIRQVSATTSINEISESKTTLYPNPFSGNATLKIDAPNDLHDASIVITDVVGRVVRELPVANKETTIHQDGLTTGMYFYRVGSKGINIANGRFVIK